MAAEPLTPARPSALSSSSSLRDRTRTIDPRARAEARVAEYLFTLGLVDESRVMTLAVQAAESAQGASYALAGTHAGAGTSREPGGLESRWAADAVAAIQARYDEFRRAVFEEDAPLVDSLWLRAFASAHPDVFLGDPLEARTRVREFGDPREGRPPTHARFEDQALVRARLPRWLLGLAPPMLVTLLAVGLLAGSLARDRLSMLELLFVAVFALLFGAAAVGGFTALYGAIASARDRPPVGVTGTPSRLGAVAPVGLALRVAEPLPRTALLMPIYHESPEHVFAALLAMRESLESTPGGEAFELFVLSDSRDPARAAEEERAFRRVASIGTSAIPLYYRRRARNEHQKAGNLAEFFERWGKRYAYAVVLDADSLMRGDTLVTLVRRMHASPRLALLQAPLALHRAETLFARAHQFAASLYGPLFTRGLAWWSGPHGNYYGHNAAIRVRAFLECCALPRLHGEPPLGGQILSHDFVEAALLCRAGWEVRMADDLGGSWEELPATVPDYIARDRRWCQGNLQHLRIATASGLEAMSRIHMLVGAGAFLMGPLWIGFLLLGVALSARTGGAGLEPRVALVASAATLVTLLAPRLLGLIVALADRARRRAHGGAARTIASALVETTIAAVLAPLLMLHHARMITSIALGNAVRWGGSGTRPRHASSGPWAVALSELASTMVGLATLGALVVFAPSLVPWLAPVWAPWIAAMPLAVLVSSDLGGRVFRRLGLLVVGTEQEPDAIAARVDELRALTASDESARFRDLVLDPILLESHLGALDGAKLGTPCHGDVQAGTPALEPLVARALRLGPAGISAADRAALMGHAPSMRELHREAWRSWPVETWGLRRERPQLPPG